MRPRLRLPAKHELQCVAAGGLVDRLQGIAQHAQRRFGVVQELLGHADPHMTSRYAHVVNMTAKRNPALFIPVKAG